MDLEELDNLKEVAFYTLVGFLRDFGAVGSYSAFWSPLKNFDYLNKQCQLFG